MRYALFIEPEGAVLDLVVAWKAATAERWPAAAYLTHPPHATVWLGAVDDPDGSRAALERGLRDVARGQVEIAAPHVFYDDRLAGGGQTLAFAVAPAPWLRALQRAAVDLLAPFERSAYAFAGPHWIPHFTVGSLPVDRGHADVDAFLATGAAGLATPCRLGWWRIDGETHERLGLVSPA